MRLSEQTKRPENNTKLPDLDKMTKRLEMLCTEMYLGFESLTLRQRRHKLCIACDDFFVKIIPCSRRCSSFSPKSLLTFRGPRKQ